MTSGVVKWFHRVKGYGLITPADGSSDVFVFYPSIDCEGLKELKTGQQVRFEATDCTHGRRATRVTPH